MARLLRCTVRQPNDVERFVLHDVWSFTATVHNRRTVREIQRPFVGVARSYCAIALLRDCCCACRADLAAAALVALRLVSLRLLHTLCFPSSVIGLTV